MVETADQVRLARQVDWSAVRGGNQGLRPMQRLVVGANQLRGDQLWLTPEQQHYLYRVLRLTTGSQFIALDGQGQHWLAQLGPEPGMAIARPQVVEALARPTITLAIALPKGNGFDPVVRQATELGVSRLQPILSERTLLQPSTARLDRWQRIAAEATEQSERLQQPQILPPLAWADYLARLDHPRQAWLCVPRQAAPHLLSLALRGPLTGDLVIATGPEGGWTEVEIATALAARFQPASLGPLILRAVTAPLAALAL
ncbi:MAG: 16S rRNA (uracil(1498)-N(3))-methyltransferase, partial [Nodosilinea sp.]